VLMLFNLGSVNMNNHSTTWCGHHSRQIWNLLRICVMGWRGSCEIRRLCRLLWMILGKSCSNGGQTYV
jgi:hypothetical protein